MSTSLSDEPLVYKVREVAGFLSTTIQTVHKLIRSGELLALDLSARGAKKPTLRITRASFESYVDSARARYPFAALGDRR